MQQSPVTQTSFRALAHIPIDEPMKKQIKALNDQASIQSMDKFYLEMLEQLSPNAQKQRYLEQLNKKIQALFRVDRIVVAVLYTDQTVKCYDSSIASLINSIKEAPLTTSRIGFILHNHYADRSSLDFYSGDYPTQLDFNKGYLFNDADLEAGYCADETTIEGLMCDWLQHYQLWMQDYLYFNLAQVKNEIREGDLNTSIKPLFDSSQTLEESTELLLSK